ncbi:MAG: DUF504 domain-containing protein [Thermoplasmatales archaeon]|nr:DUF504 domain-containing protein [Thermoplasmatales archaeon]
MSDKCAHCSPPFCCCYNTIFTNHCKCCCSFFIFHNIPQNSNFNIATVYKYFVRRILNKLKWDKKYDFNKVVVWYISRGNENDIDYLKGEDIINIGGYFLETKRGMIPYHRIIKVEYEGKEIRF